MAKDVKGNIKNQDLRLAILKLITKEIEKQSQLAEDYEPPEVPEMQKMRVQYELGEISLDDYTQFLKQKMAELEEQGLKYSSEWKRIYNAIQGIKDEAPEGLMKGLMKGIQDKFLSKLGKAGSMIMNLVSGNWLGAIISLITSTESFQILVEVFSDVFGALVKIFDTVFGPVIKAVAIVIRVFWNALMDIISAIPFINMDEYKIDKYGEDGGDGGDGGDGEEDRPTGGTTITHVSGAMRDELKNLLKPLAALSQLPMYEEQIVNHLKVLPGKLDQIISNTNSLRGLLTNTNLDQIDFQGADGMQVVDVDFNNTTFNENYTMDDAFDDIERRFGIKLLNKLRGKGKR
jgi:hypothetical protein